MQADWTKNCQVNIQIFYDEVVEYIKIYVSGRSIVTSDEIVINVNKLLLVQSLHMLG